MVRLTLAEKHLDFEARVEKVWERRGDFLAMSPTGEVPVLVEPDGATLFDASVIVEYLDECYPAPPLLGEDRLARAETRRLVSWFNGKFGHEVTDNLVGEKIIKRLFRDGYPDSEAIRTGKANIQYHLDYLDYLAEQRRWLAGDAISLADITAAAHLSVIDYLGDVPWENHGEARDWYARIKSAPQFPSPAAGPSPWYAASGALCGSGLLKAAGKGRSWQGASSY